MNINPVQLFDVENYKDALVIFSAFGTKEVIFKGPYHFWDAFRKIRYWIIADGIQRIKKTGERKVNLDV